MDLTTLRIISTLACFGLFLGIAWWAFARHNRARFDEAASIPFDQD